MNAPTTLDRNQIAVTTYRRANGSQATTIRPRVQRAPKTFPRAHTPSPAARRAANQKRKSDAWVAAMTAQMEAQKAERFRKGYR